MRYFGVSYRIVTPNGFMRELCRVIEFDSQCKQARTMKGGASHI